MYITAVLTPDETTKQAVSSANAAEETTDFSDCLSDAQNIGTLASIFQKAAETYGVSYTLLTAMAKQESNFQADATSKSGAMGIMQLMPATAASLGCENAYDPEQNIMAGAKYISQLLEKYDGNVPLALAAYNAGSNNVDKYGGIPPFKETQDYVVKITAYMNEGVTLPDGTVVYGNTDSSDTIGLTASLLKKLSSPELKEALDKIFSYEDYLKFINLFMQGISNALSAAETKEEQKQDSSDAGATASPAKTEDKDSVEKKTLDVTFNGNPDAYYTYQSPNYNKNIMNLLSQPNGG